MWGYLPGWQVITRSSGVRVGAGSPGAGFGLVVWLAVGVRAGGRQGAAVGSGAPVEWPAAQANCLRFHLDQKNLRTIFA